MYPAAPPVQLTFDDLLYSPPGPKYPLGQPGTGKKRVIIVWTATKIKTITHCGALSIISLNISNRVF